MDRVDPLWKVVQDGLTSRSAVRIQDHPYVGFYMLNDGTYPDFLELARQAHPEVSARLRDAYRAGCSGALDEIEPGEIAPTSRTAQHFYYLVRLVAWLGDMSAYRICEIGGGFGNVMRMAVQLGLCAEYHLADIPGVTDLQRRYADDVLDRRQRATVEVFDIENDADLESLSARPYDLVLSFFGMTEAPHDMRQWYLDHLLSRAPNIYVVGQDQWRNQKVGRHLTERLADRFALRRAPFCWADVGESTTFELFATARPQDGATATG